MHLYLHLRSAEFDIRVALAYHDCVCTVVVNGFRESLWSSMRWLHNLRCQGCSEAKHRAIFDRANVRQRSELYWGGWAEEIPDPKPQTVGEDQPRDRLEPKKYRLRWLRLCKTCAHMRTEMVAEWKALQLRLKLGEEARLRARGTQISPTTTSGHTLIVAGPLSGRHAAARALAEQGDLGDQGQGFGWGFLPGATKEGIRPGQSVPERYRTLHPGSGFKNFITPSNQKEFSTGTSAKR
jgi:hypothetical protein